MSFVTILIAGLGHVRRANLPPSPRTRLGDIPLSDVRGSADNIILLGLDRRTRVVRLLDLPRDTVVNVPGRGRERLSQFMAYVSFAEFKKTVEDITQMPVERYILADLEGFPGLAGSAGRGRRADPADPADPADALTLTRDDAATCAELGRQLLSALGKTLGAGELASALWVYRRSPDLVKTNLSPREAAALWREWGDYDPGRIEHLVLPGVPDGQYRRLDPAGVKATLERFWPPGVAAESPASPPAVCPKFEAVAGFFARCLAHLAGLDRQRQWSLLYRPYLRAHPPGPTPPALIYHTHATESFMPEIITDPGERGFHDPDREAFSADLSLTVVRVGEELGARLGELGFEVTHDLGVHDYGGSLGRTGAYTRSREAAVAALRSLPDPVLVIDVHRDATTVRTEVGGKSAAGFLFVVARQNPWWQWNYVFARNLDDGVRAVSPGLSRGLRILDGRYNQDLSPLALLVEIGGADSTLDECLYSANILAGILGDYMSGP